MAQPASSRHQNYRSGEKSNAVSDSMMAGREKFPLKIKKKKSRTNTVTVKMEMSPWFVNYCF